MTETIIDAIKACEWSPAKFLVFSDNVFEPLIYYSHLGVLILTLFFGAFIFFNNKKELANRIFFYLTLVIGIWLYSDLVLWGSEKMEYVMFFWNVEIIFEPLIYILSLYFFYVLIDKKDLDIKTRLISFSLLLPTLILAPTNLALTGFDLTNCDRVAVEGLLPKYGYFLEIMIVLWIVFLAFNRFSKSSNSIEKKKIFFTATGICLFLLSFSLGNIAEVISENWYIGQIGYIGIPIFIAFLSYQIVQFKIFNIKLIAAQVFVGAIWFLILAIVFIRSIENVRIVVGITLALFSIIGILLIRSIKREVFLRESLQEANEAQENLIHVINHQIKGYLAKARNIFSELITEPSYGAVTKSSKPLLDEGFKSLTEGVAFAQQILVGSSAQNGKLQYYMAEMDFKNLVAEAAEKQEERAKEKNLSYEVEIGEGDYKMNGDKLQLKEAIRNLIENSIIYTNEGGLKLKLSKEGNNAVFSIKDTGVGITDEDKKKLFTKGGRGKDSLKVNVNSSGYGLAFVKAVIEAHKGRVWAESEGKGTGSTFKIELPMQSA